ncbi:hypothetical protein THIOM_005160 [Candidatus Thiomargarita nelsonii]|uniref:Uncharacterized protein n=1 Tax=Candidatus Thiomargarita nelsonii TaxID=1003181 RepID=A0A176RTZ9_9GAMM|nr:hypothetical protein THIOM_005160 [Candidatus Thiomargarita nelsonii]
MLETSPAVKTQFDKIEQDSQKLQPCDGKITCAFIGSSGHGKTTIMDEMFPTLSQRKWLVTDVTDTTAQSLRISYAPPNDLEKVIVNAWNVAQIKSLMRHPEVVEQNEQDNIQVSYPDEGVDVDGTQVTFPASDVAQFRFAKKLELYPFPKPYEVPLEKSQDTRFIRALTVKEQSAVIDTAPIITQDGRSYNALQLRAIVKDVNLRDPYERIKAWSGLPDNQLADLIFVDTPGLAVKGSTKDEVLRHCLEKKSEQIALQLWQNDELDIVVHIVLCGQKSDFAVLWKTVEREYGPGAMESLSDRLILAVNGMSKYFTDPNIKRKYEEPETAKREGDHFDSTLEDNILQKMSPRGRIKPARICFLDAKSHVANYEEVYQEYRPIMEKWVEPGNIGYKTLSKLNLVDSFKENIEALANPEDRGQGFLVRQILSLIEEKGPALLLRKYLVRTGLLNAIKDFLEMLTIYYDQDGTMNQGMMLKAVRDGLHKCLSDPDDILHSIEEFATNALDAKINKIVTLHGKRKVSADWVIGDFYQMCSIVKQTIIEQSKMPEQASAQFQQYFENQEEQWVERWGYTSAQLSPPKKGTSGDLVTHCLKLHCREILHQLLTEVSDEPARFEQSAEDKQRVCEIINRLNKALQYGKTACKTNGV